MSGNLTDLRTLAFLTADVPGIGGRIKTRREDFVVDEVPLYEPCGEGTHVYFRIVKTGIPTLQAIHEVARAIGVRAHDIGYAGLKDANAVTSQMLSLEHVDPDRVAGLELPHIRVAEVSRHRNKLKLGHLAGNRFTLRIREVDRKRATDAQRVMDILVRRGVPNYFGEQRFGMRGDTWEIGQAMLAGNLDAAIAIMLGRPGPRDYGEVLRARQLFEQGDYDGAADAWPYPFTNERRVCRELARRKGNTTRAFRAVDRYLRRLYLSAFQSYLFNQIVARRIGSLDRLIPGDLAWRHPQGAVFRVEDTAVEQPRCDAFEISPTGPLFGHRMTSPTGEPGQMELDLLQKAGIDPSTWQGDPDRRLPGGRRPLRFQPHEANVETGHDHFGDYIELRFRLESGCYATAILREICKTTVEAPTDEPEVDQA